MKIEVEWYRALSLKDATKEDMIYGVDLSKVPPVAGIYIFGRRWGQQFEALYVGKANSVRGRVKDHLNNLRLMQHIRNAKAGKRVVIAGRVVPHQGQKLGKCMALAERVLIRHFLSEGDDLVNKQGTKLRTHEVNSSGKYPKKFFPNVMYLERAKGE